MTTPAFDHDGLPVLNLATGDPSQFAIEIKVHANARQVGKQSLIRVIGEALIQAGYDNVHVALHQSLDYVEPPTSRQKQVKITVSEDLTGHPSREYIESVLPVTIQKVTKAS